MQIEFLKEKRRLAKLTQEDVGKYIGIGKASWQKIEKGKNNLHPKHWEKIKVLLGISESEICDFTAMVAIKKRHERIKKGEIKPDFWDLPILDHNNNVPIRIRVHALIDQISEARLIALEPVLTLMIVNENINSPVPPEKEDKNGK